MLIKKNAFFFVGALIIIICIFICLPQNYQDKVIRKLIWPYQAIYAIGLKNELNHQRCEMYCFYNNLQQHGVNAYIAHGGGVGNLYYTNSVEAVLDSIKKGFKYIEIDLLETVDGHFIGGHGWAAVSELTGKSVEELKIMPLAELKKLKLNGNLTVLSSIDISRILAEHTNIILVTDITQNYELLLKEIPYPNRMIVEVLGGRYFYKKALESGIRYPAYSTDDIDLLLEYEFPIVVINAKLLLDEFNLKKIKKLHDKKVTILVHNADICDKPEFLVSHLGKNISMIYTNKWFPTGDNPNKTSPSQLQQDNFSYK